MDWKEVGTALAAVLVGFGAIAHRVRRAHSREGVEQAKDAAETRLISRLEEERNFARDEAARERAQRIEDGKLLAIVQAENVYLKSYARRLIRALPERERKVYETDFSPFDDKPMPPAPAPAAKDPPK